MLIEAKSKYPDVKIMFGKATDNIRKYCDIKPVKANITLDIIKQLKRNVLVVKSENDIFGTQPFLAIKTKERRYIYDNFDFFAKNEWRYVFDDYTLPINLIDTIGVAANSTSGMPEVIIKNV